MKAPLPIETFVEVLSHLTQIEPGGAYIMHLPAEASDYAMDRIKDALRGLASTFVERPFFLIISDGMHLEAVSTMMLQQIRQEIDDILAARNEPTCNDESRAPLSLD